MVRPVKSTSSTSTTTWPARSTRDVGHRLGQDRAQADVVAVEGDIEGAEGDLVALDLLQEGGHRAARGTPPVCRPTRTTSSMPPLRSTTSWDIRVRARWTSGAVITWEWATNTPPRGRV